MVYVYILQSKKDSGYYIGISKNVQHRLNEHNLGKTTSTKNRRPFVLKYTERFNDYKAARNREIEIKSFKGGNKFKVLIR